MRVSVSEAKGQLTDLVRRAEAGEEIVLTRHGHPAVRLARVARPLTLDEKRRLIATVQKSAASRADSPTSARSQDFLYGDDGLPA